MWEPIIDAASTAQPIPADVTTPSTTRPPTTDSLPLPDTGSHARARTDDARPTIRAGLDRAEGERLLLAKSRARRLLPCASGGRRRGRSCRCSGRHAIVHGDVELAPASRREQASARQHTANKRYQNPAIER
jgi:hypothetical protein